MYIKNNEIWYTNGSNIIPTPLHNTEQFNTSIISTVYSAKIKNWVITFDNDVTTIGSEAFFRCYSLTTVTIPDGITSIENSAFGECSGLTSITIGNGITSIENSAFGECTSLTSIYCKATTPPTLGGTSVFYNNGSGRKIYVPYQSLDAYKTASNWSKYADDIVGYDFENDTIV